MKLSEVTTATIKAYIKHRRAEERVVSRERTILNLDGTVTVVPEVRRRPSNAQINRETTVLGRMFSLARQDDKIINRPPPPKLTAGLDSPYVFGHLAGVRVGKRFSYGGFYKAWQRAVRGAGVARVPHDFRRTAIRNLERDGVPRSVAMAMVGQKTEEVYRRYAI